MHRLNNTFRTFFINKYIVYLFMLLLTAGSAGASENKAIYILDADQAQIELSLDNKTDYQLENNGQNLIITFSKPYANLLANAANELGDYIKAVDISEDRKQLLLHLQHPVNSNSFRLDNKIIIELRTPESALRKKAAAQPPLSANLKFGLHPGYARFAFDFDRKPVYSVNSDGESTKIIFLNKPQIHAVNLEDYAKAEDIHQRPNKFGGLNFVIPAPLLKSFEVDGRRLIVDVRDLTLPETALSVTQPEENTTAPQTIEAQNRFKTINRTSNLAAGQMSEETAPHKVASLSFSWNIPVNLALFERGKYIWAIFDHAQTLNLEEMRANTSSLVDDIIQLPHNSATIVRIHPKENVHASVRKEGLLWIVDLFTGETPTETKSLPLLTQYDGLKRAYLFIPTTSSGNIIFTIDPDIGDTLIAAPIADLGEGFTSIYNYPDFDIFPSNQGLAIVSKASDINVNRGNTGLTIKALDRGLNISPNLDMLKRHERFMSGEEGTSSFDLKISPQLMEQDFNTSVSQLLNDVLTVPANQKNKARFELAKYYIANGLGTNALGIIGDISRYKEENENLEKIYALRGVANFLTGRYEQAVEDFSYGNLPNHDEAVFWRTLASSAIKPEKENNAVLLSYIFLIKDYPQELKERIALIGAETALAAHDDISVQNFIDILKASDISPNRRAQGGYINARKSLLQGYQRNAVNEFLSIANSTSQKYSSLARFEGIILGQKLGMLSLDRAIGELEKLRFAWGEKVFKLELLQNLARLYVEKRDFYNAMKTYEETLPLSEDAEKEATMQKMISLFEDIYLDNQADNMSPLKSLALYEDFEWLAPKSPRYNDIIQRLADRLVAVDLMNRAAEVLRIQLKQTTLSPLQRNKIGTRMALIYLFEDQPLEAIKILDATAVDKLPPALATHRKVIRAKAYSRLGRPEDALKILEGDYSKNAILLKSEIYWNAGRWGDASDTIKYLIEKPIPGEPLSAEQIGYILDWATALKKAGRETVIVRLRNKFLPYFEKTKYYSAFSILTNLLENDTINLKEINQAITDIAAFSNFTKMYNDSLKNGGLSKTIE